MKFTFKSNFSDALSPTLVAIVLALSSSQWVAAQELSAVGGNSTDSHLAGISDRYPSGSIRSVEIADHALTDVEQERSLVEARFADEERACYPKFFVTSCLDAAKEKRRRALAEIQQVEVEANAFKRRARVEERDKALADKAPQAAPIIKPSKEVKESNAVPKKSTPSVDQRSDRSGAPKDRDEGAAIPDRAAQHKAKLEKLNEEEAASARKRAENVAEYERKVRAAEERQREVAARKAEKERKRAAKNSSATPKGN